MSFGLARDFVGYIAEIYDNTPSESDDGMKTRHLRSAR